MSYGVNLHQAEAGKKSIGAVATEKVQSDALNLGFPSVYSSVYASRGIAPRYFPTMRPEQHGEFWRGSDLMAHVHEERRKDANYMAGAKVRSTQLSRVRFVGTPHGRGVLPPAVLGQRIFANPSQGALPSGSAREDQSGPFHLAGAEGAYSSVHTPLPRDTQGLHQVPLVGDSLVGGVLRTMTGQKHGRKVLTDRVAQLNQIEIAKQEFNQELPMSGDMPSERLATETPVGEGSAIELSLLLQGVIDAVIGGEAPPDNIDHLSAFTMKDATRALALIFRLAPQMDQTSLDDTYGKVDLIINSVGAILDPAEDTTLSSQSREIALTLQVLFTKLRVYIEKMIEGRNLSGSERLALSKALVNSLGFSKMLKYSANDYNAMLSSADRNHLFTAQQYQRYRAGDMGVDGDGRPDDDDDDRFNRPAGPREDEEHDASTGVERSDRGFTPDVRQEFGTQSGLFFPNGGRGDREFFGEVAQGLMGDVTVQRRGPPPPEQLPLEARPLPRAPPSVASAVSRVPQPQIGSFWDDDTQAFNVATVGRPLPPSGAPSVATRSTATRSVGVNEMGRPEKHYNKLPTRARERNEMEGSVFIRALNPRGAIKTSIKPITITSQSQLPKTREGFIELAKRLRRSDIQIRVNEGSAVAQIKKNFIKRLGLAGRL